MFALPGSFSTLRSIGELRGRWTQRIPKMLKGFHLTLLQWLMTTLLIANPWQALFSSIETDRSLMKCPETAEAKSDNT